MKGATVVLGFAALLLCSGCYVTRQAMGQLSIGRNSIPVEEFLASDAPEAQKAKVQLIGEARRYAVEVLGFEQSDNYTVYYDTGGKPVVTVVTACRKDRFEPYRWWFPIVGSVPYLGFFDPEGTRELAAELAEDGYDVRVGGARAYSTLGWFTDPILSTMLDDPDYSLVELILHELTHSHVYLEGNGDFNESLATFVAREATLQFLRARPGRFEDYRTALVRFSDAERYDRFVLGLYKLLKTYYDSKPDDVLEGRERIIARARDALRRDRRNYYSRMFERYLKAPLDNCAILARRRYGRTAEFRPVFEAVRGDWRDFFAVVRKATEADDPFEVLALAGR